MPVSVSTKPATGRPPQQDNPSYSDIPQLHHCIERITGPLRFMASGHPDGFQTKNRLAVLAVCGQPEVPAQRKSEVARHHTGSDVDLLSENKRPALTSGSPLF